MMPIESNPSISLPLLIGLSRSTGSTTINNNNNNKATATTQNENEKQPSNNTKTQPPSTTTTNNTKQLNFPQKLHALLSNNNTNKNNTQHVISWMVHGRSFKVHNVTCFVTQLLSEHFNNNTSSVASSDATLNTTNNNTNTNINKEEVEIADYEQFETILKSWGFQQICTSNKQDVGSWYHEKFLRGHVDLVTEIVQRSVDNINKKSEGDKSGKEKGSSEKQAVKNGQGKTFAKKQSSSSNEEEEAPSPRTEMGGTTPRPDAPKTRRAARGAAAPRATEESGSSRRSSRRRTPPDTEAGSPARAALSGKIMSFFPMSMAAASRAERAASGASLGSDAAGASRSPRSPRSPPATKGGKTPSSRGEEAPKRTD